MRWVEPLAICVGALLTASVALAGTTMRAPAKPPVASGASVTPSATIHKDMQLTKEQIIALQSALAKRSVYRGKADGTLGKETQAALRQFQKTNHLPVTGNPDEQTMEKLGVQVASTAMGQAPNGPGGQTPTPH